MSWSVFFIGTPEKVVNALEKHAEGHQGTTKEEYDAALPHLIGLINQNYNKDADNVIIKIDANGSGYANTRTCNVSISHMYGVIL